MSNYFDRLYEYAVELVGKGKAYVDDLTPEETDEFRRIGKESPFRDRSVEENLDLFARMKAGEFPDGTRTLRAKIDMSASRMSGCEIRCFIAFVTPSITIRETNGAFTRCTIGRIR